MAGVGLENTHDWLRLTWALREVKSVGPYSDCGQMWQYMLDWALATYPCNYHQLARGHDKTERESWWALMWGLSADHGQAFACGVDKDNARLFRDAAKWQIAKHPQLLRDYKVHNYDIIHRKNGTVIRILASDEESNYGLTPDLLLINDFHAWQNEGFWNALWTAMGKRLGSRIWIESNALALGAPQSNWIKPVRDLAQAEWQTKRGIWFYYRPTKPGFLATWQYHMLPSWKKTMLPGSFQRLIDNEDNNDSNSFVTLEQVESLETLSGPTDPQAGGRIVVATDLGLTTDAAVVAVVGQHATPHAGVLLALHQLDIWVGSREKPVNIREVADRAEYYAKKYKAEHLVGDPYEMQAIFQANSRWEEFKFNPTNVRNLTHRLWRSITERKIRLYPNAAPAMQTKSAKPPEAWNLKRELTEAVLKDMSYGTRVDHRAAGFSDRLMAVGMAVHLLLEDETEPRLTRTIPPTPGEGPTMGEIFDRICAEREIQQSILI